MTKQALAAILASFTMSCTIFSPQNELYDGLKEPTSLAQINNLTVTKMDFFNTGWICIEKAGLPAFFHPLILTTFGCAELEWRDGKVFRCEVIYSMDWVLEHELKHCEGWRD